MSTCSSAFINMCCMNNKDSPDNPYSMDNLSNMDNHIHHNQTHQTDDLLRSCHSHSFLYKKWNNIPYVGQMRKAWAKCLDWYKKIKRFIIEMLGYSFHIRILYLRKNR